VAGDYGWTGHLSKGLVDTNSVGKPPLDDLTVYYGIQPWDCREEPVKGVTVELQVLEGMALRPCDTCTVVYSNDLGLPNPNFKNFSSLGQIAYISGPAAGQSVIVMRDAKTRRAVAALSLVTLPGHWHNVFLYPPSSDQLKEFPWDSL